MDLKTKLIVSCIALSMAFAVGRYTAPAGSVTKTVTDTASSDQKQIDRDTIKKIITTTTKKPDGEEQTTTETTISTNTHVNDTKSSETHQEQTVTIEKKPVLNVSLLAGVDVIRPLSGPVYGASVSKEFIGPITLGVWGLTNSTVGVSVGLNF